MAVKYFLSFRQIVISALLLRLLKVGNVEEDRACFVCVINFLFAQIIVTYKPLAVFSRQDFVTVHCMSR